MYLSTTTGIKHTFYYLCMQLSCDAQHQAGATLEVVVMIAGKLKVMQ